MECDAFLRVQGTLLLYLMLLECASQQNKNVWLSVTEYVFRAFVPLGPFRHPSEIYVYERPGCWKYCLNNNYYFIFPTSILTFQVTQSVVECFI